MAGSGPSKNENLFEEHINIYAYYQKGNQKIAAINLLFNGFKILQDAKVVKDFDLYRSIQYTEVQRPQQEVIAPFINNSLMDDTKIIICFENYMKAILIHNDYVVHKVTDKLKNLKFEQRDRPLKISEVFQQSSFTSYNPLTPSICETNYQTLNFSWMLKPKYQVIINLPTDLLAIISEINEERNKLHFMLSHTFSFGEKTIEKYQKIIEFADATIKKCIIELDPTMKSRLDALN